MRCAECDCENGDGDCNWIATPPALASERCEHQWHTVRTMMGNVVAECMKCLVRMPTYNDALDALHPHPGE